MGQLATAVPSLNKLAQQELPGNVSWDVAQLLQKVAPHMAAYELVKNKYIKKYDYHPPEDPQGYTVPMDKINEFQKNMQPTLTADIVLEFRSFNKFHKEDFEKVNMTPVEILQLQPFLEDEDLEPVEPEKVKEDK